MSDTWIKWIKLGALLMTAVIAVISAIGRTDIKAIVLNGWTWFYAWAIGYTVFYFVDLFMNVRRWANGAQGEANKALVSMSAKVQSFDADMTSQRSEWGRTFALANHAFDADME